MMTRPELEARRREGKRMLATHTITEVSRRLGVARTSVYRWLDMESLASTKATGRPQTIPYDRIAALIEEQEIQRPITLQAAIIDKFGKSLHQDHCRRLLKRLRGQG